MVDTNIIIASSKFAGFKNYAHASFSASYAGGNIAAGAYVGPIRASTALNNTNAVTEVQCQYSGLDTFWRYVPGTVVANYPNTAAVQYQIETLTYFSGGQVFVDSYIVNQTAGIVAVPAIVFNCVVFLYVAPF